MGAACPVVKIKNPRSVSNSTRGRTRRRLKTRAPMFSMLMLIVFAVALPFVHANIYANLKKTSYSKDEYEAKRWRERVENERLKVLVDQHSSYSNLKGDALNMGMVPATHYDFLKSPQFVASR